MVLFERVYESYGRDLLIGKESRHKNLLKKPDLEALTIFAPYFARQNLNFFLIREPFVHSYRELEVAAIGSDPHLRREIGLFEQCTANPMLNPFPGIIYPFKIGSLQIGIPLDENYNALASFALESRPYLVRRWKNCSPIKLHFIDELVAAPLIGDKEKLFLYLKNALEQGKYEVAIKLRGILANLGVSKGAISHVTRPHVHPKKQFFNKDGKIVSNTD